MSTDAGRVYTLGPDKVVDVLKSCPNMQDQILLTVPVIWPEQALEQTAKRHDAALPFITIRVGHEIAKDLVKPEHCVLDLEPARVSKS
jgi:hypothetical protein